VLFCPADTDEILLNTKNNAWKGNKITNYMYHAWLGHIVYASSFATYRPRTLARCFAPSTCAIMIDGKCKNRQPIFDIQVPSNATSYIADRHSGGTNVLYADNHVSWFNLASASQEEITRIFMWNNKKDWRY
jgi:prepilin-type processing-associated H-X9-DG protein